MSAGVEVPLSLHRGRLALYCRALLGREVPVRPLGELIDKDLGWRDASLPSSDGSTIYLPDSAPPFVPPAQVGGWYKLAATQQLGHIAFGSFGSPPVAGSTVTAAEVAYGATTAGHTRGAAEGDRQLLSELSRFLWSLQDAALAQALFCVLECVRVEAHNRRRYPGLAPEYRALAALELQQRGHAQHSGHRLHWVQELLRASLMWAADEHGAVSAARLEMHGEALARVSDVGAQLGDTMAAVEVLHEALLRDGDQSTQTPGRLAGVPPVSYRGALHPHLVHLRLALARPRPGTQHGRVPPRVSRQGLQRYVDRSVEGQEEPEGPPAPVQRRLLADNMLREWLDAERSLSRSRAAERPAPPDPAGQPRSAPAAGDGGFAYDEWDAHRAGYLRGHCRVWEHVLPAGDERYYDDALERLSSVASRVRRELTALPHSATRRHRRLLSGPLHDLDAAIEAQVDRRSGHTPSERVFECKRRSDRSVATVVLVDISASTAERLAPADGKTRPQRVIDLQKDALVLLVDGLSRLDDAHAIYAFSGYGADQVDLFTIKEFGERSTRAVARRIGGIRPQYATRMGAAIRHCSAKLSAQPQRSRFILVLSDGRPQDRDYSEGGRDPQYAVGDTRMALVEARRAGLSPFCVTVDQDGQDYLAEMCGTGYQVVSDVRALPLVLPRIYRQLTT